MRLLGDDVLSSLSLPSMRLPKVCAWVKKFFNLKDFLCIVSFPNLRVNPTRFLGSFPPKTTKTQKSPPEPLHHERHGRASSQAISPGV